MKREYFDYFCIGGGETLIEDIKRLRDEGLSLRKSAARLNTTVGKVQYRWNKWINEQDQTEISENEQNEAIVKEESPIVINHGEGTAMPVEELETVPAPIKGELQARLVSPRKLVLFWEPSQLPEQIITLYYNKKFDDLVHVVRIYDVTNLIFTGDNAHHYYEIAIPYSNGYWFVKGLTSNCSYVAELGVKFNPNEYFPILRSNSVQTMTEGQKSESEIYYHLMNDKQLEQSVPKWIDHVSTYSYYGIPANQEQKNG